MEFKEVLNENLLNGITGGSMVQFDNVMQGAFSKAEAALGTLAQSCVNQNDKALLKELSAKCGSLAKKSEMNDQRLPNVMVDMLAECGKLSAAVQGPALAIISGLQSTVTGQ